MNAPGPTILGANLHSAAHISGSPRPGHTPALDGVRGVAILIVCVYHFGLPYIDRQSESGDRAFSALIGMGWSGVDLFFVLSGYLITGILLDTRTSLNCLSSFFARRFLRIFPLYYAFLAAWFWAAPWLGNQLGRDLSGIVRPEQQVWYWTYTQNISQGLGLYIPGLGHFWSLAIEEQFYVLWPLVVLFVREPSRLARWSAVLAASALLARFGYLLLGGSPQMVYRLTLCRMDPLLVGAFLAASARTGYWAAVRTRAWPFTLLVLVALIALAPFSDGLERLHPLTQTAGYALLSLLFGGFLAVVLISPKEGHLVRWLTSPGLRSFGKFSYAIYVFHWPLSLYGGIYLSRIGWMQGRWSYLAFAFTGILTSYVLARASWWVLEERVLGLKDRFAAKWPEGA